MFIRRRQQPKSHATRISCLCRWGKRVHLSSALIRPSRLLKGHWKSCIPVSFFSLCIWSLCPLVWKYGDSLSTYQLSISRKVEERGEREGVRERVEWERGDRQQTDRQTECVWTEMRQRGRCRSSLFHESPFLVVGFARDRGVRVKKGTGIPSVYRYIDHVIFAIFQQAPIVPDVVSARRATANTHNGNRWMEIFPTDKQMHMHI